MAYFFRFFKLSLSLLVLLTGYALAGETDSVDTTDATAPSRPVLTPVKYMSRDEAPDEANAEIQQFCTHLERHIWEQACAGKRNAAKMLLFSKLAAVKSALDTQCELERSIDSFLVTIKQLAGARNKYAHHMLITLLFTDDQYVEEGCVIRRHWTQTAGDDYAAWHDYYNQHMEYFAFGGSDAAVAVVLNGISDREAKIQKAKELAENKSPRAAEFYLRCFGKHGLQRRSDEALYLAAAGNQYAMSEHVNNELMGKYSAWVPNMECQVPVDKIRQYAAAGNTAAFHEYVRKLSDAPCERVKYYREMADTGMEVAIDHYLAALSGEPAQYLEQLAYFVTEGSLVARERLYAAFYYGPNIYQDEHQGETIRKLDERLLLRLYEALGLSGLAYKNFF